MQNPLAPGVLGNGPRDECALLLAARQRRKRPVGAGGHPDVLQRPIDERLVPRVHAAEGPLVVVIYVAFTVTPLTLAYKLRGQLDGTQIGAFNDRLRDAVHGGGPFDTDHRVFQGFGSGAVTDPNGLDTRGAEEQLADLMHRTDLVKLGVAGNLKDYALTTYDGSVKLGSQIDYNSLSAGYASDPAESVNYVDAHDNETLFDLLTYKLPSSTPMSDRIRMNTVSLATVALTRSEERRVGKECRSRWSPYH